MVGYSVPGELERERPRRASAHENGQVPQLARPELLGRVGASAEDTELQETCKLLGFDTRPGNDPEGGVGGGGGVRGGPTTGPKQRIDFW